LIIVDAYCHFGECRVYDASVSEYDVIDALNTNKVSAILLQPFPGAPNPVPVHDSIAELGARYPGRVFGLVNCNPHVHRDLYHREVERCVRELGFVGITLDTVGHAVNPNGQDGQTVFEAARELGVPIVIHTGPGLFASPARILLRAREYDDVKIVLAHAGAGLSTFDAYVVAKEAMNVYLETSGCRGDETKWLIDELGPSRILFGSDRIENLAAELAKNRALGLYQFQQYQVFGQTATDLFGLHGISDVTEVAPAPVVENAAEVPTETTPEPAVEVATEAVVEPGEAVVEESAGSEDENAEAATEAPNDETESAEAAPESQVEAHAVTETDETVESSSQTANETTSDNGHISVPAKPVESST